MPACVASPLGFDAIIAPICGFPTLFPCAVTDTTAELHRFYAGQTRDHFAVQSLKDANFVNHPSDTRLLPVLAYGNCCLASGGKCPVEFACFPVRQQPLGPAFIPTDLVIRRGLASDLASL
jgi:hypothetical protein